MTQAPEQSTAKGWRPDDSTFGARLALVRQRMGWGNVREAAVACGIPPESWRTWERDNVAPRRLVEMATLIANRTGCDFYWLIAGPRAGNSEPTSPNHRSAQVRRLGNSTPGRQPFGPKPPTLPRPASAKRRPTLIGPGVRTM